MTPSGAVLIGPHLLPKLEALLFTEQHGPRKHAEINRELIGKNADDILARIGMSVPPATRLGIVEVDVDHPLLWTEQMMPIMPICRVRSADAAIDLAVQIEGGNRHTAVMHSRNIDALSRMARRATARSSSRTAARRPGSASTARGTARSPSPRPTGEGLTGPRSFSRWRRCTHGRPLPDHVTR